MLWDASSINGLSLQASDGVFGHVSDLLFEDVGWSSRRLVVDTRIWPFGESVDLPLSMVTGPDFSAQSFQTSKTLEALGAELTAFAHTQRARDPLLLSAAAFVGYAIVATDGDIGHVADVQVDPADGVIKFVTVHTADWWPGVKVLIAPDSVAKIDKETRRLVLDINSESVRAAPVFDSGATLDGREDAKFLTYFGVRWTAS
jgi:hypothetical protein